MHFKYCPECGGRLIEKEIGDEGKVPFCEKCKNPLFDMFSACIDEGKVPFCEKCKNPLFDMFSACIIVLVVNEYDEAVLLRQEYISEKYYNLVSGYMKPGETAEVTAEREVYEEIGVQFCSLEPVKTYWFAKKDMLMIGFIGKTNQTGFSLSKEVDSAEWIPVYQALDLVHPKGSVSRALLEEFIKKKK